MSQLYRDAIFWIETDKIEPNPFQPRKEFDEAKLRELAESVRQYGILQPLVVTRVEEEKEDGGIRVRYQLIAGERRLRASKLASLKQVPVIIRRDEDNKVKLELAIIENLQREDLNPVDRAKAFLRLQDEFSLSHAQIGKKMGKSREYVSNTMRLLQLPEDIMQALANGKITEGHTRPLMMLKDRPMEQETLFKEIMYKKMSVRDSEKIARSIATDKIRKQELRQNPQIQDYQSRLSEKLGTRVYIEQKDGAAGGKIMIDFFSPDDIEHIVAMLRDEKNGYDMMERFIEKKDTTHNVIPSFSSPLAQQESPALHSFEPDETDHLAHDDRSKEEQKDAMDDPDLYNINSFSV